MVLTENEKWEAVIKCDKTYDGQFFYGVKTTGIFCKPSCSSKTPLRKNCEFFDEIDKAYTSGLRPCKRCRPDLSDYKPVLNY
jgi:AraC family transcriptional regulator, regulatory protein of adaptative response / methylphosphotriester-DNA alkyltransferase methyltransferase